MLPWACAGVNTRVQVCAGVHGHMWAHACAACWQRHVLRSAFRVLCSLFPCPVFPVPRSPFHVPRSMPDPERGRGPAGGRGGPVFKISSWRRWGGCCSVPDVQPLPDVGRDQERPGGLWEALGGTGVPVLPHCWGAGGYGGCGAVYGAVLAVGQGGYGTVYGAGGHGVGCRTGLGVCDRAGCGAGPWGRAEGCGAGLARRPR